MRMATAGIDDERERHEPCMSFAPAATRSWSASIRCCAMIRFSPPAMFRSRGNCCGSCSIRSCGFRWNPASSAPHACPIACCCLPRSAARRSRQGQTRGSGEGRRATLRHRTALRRPEPQRGAPTAGQFRRGPCAGRIRPDAGTGIFRSADAGRSHLGDSFDDADQRSDRARRGRGSRYTSSRPAKLISTATYWRNISIRAARRSSRRSRRRIFCSLNRNFDHPFISLHFFQGGRLPRVRRTMFA